MAAEESDNNQAVAEAPDLLREIRTLLPSAGPQTARTALAVGAQIIALASRVRKRDEQCQSLLDKHDRLLTLALQRAKEGDTSIACNLPEFPKVNPQWARLELSCLEALARLVEVQLRWGGPKRGNLPNAGEKHRERLVQDAKEKRKAGASLFPGLRPVSSTKPETEEEGALSDG